MAVLQLLNYMHNNLQCNDGPLYYAGVTFGTLTDAGISKGYPMIRMRLIGFS